MKHQNRKRRAIQIAGIAVIVAVIIVIIVGIVLAVIASMPSLTEGVVIDKDYEPPYTSTETRITDDGSNRLSTRTMHHGAQYSIRVSGKTADGEVRSEWWYVGEGVYAMVNIGDRVIRDPDTDAIRIKGGALYGGRLDQ